VGSWLGEVLLLAVLVGDSVAAALSVPQLLTVPSGAREGVGKSEGVGCAEALNTDGEALELEAEVWEVEAEELTELLPLLEEDWLVEDVGDTLSGAFTLPVPGWALAVGCSDTVEQRLEVAFQESVGRDDSEALALELAFHTETLGVEVGRAEAEAVAE
jgi:hypothetical protein